MRKSEKQPVLGEIARRWEAFRVKPFPDITPEIEKSDLVLIDTYSAGCISVFVANQGKLDRERIDILRSCAADLDPVTNRLTGDAEEYFTELSQLSHLILQFVK